MSMHQLGRLIAERMGLPAHRWSFRDVERRALDAGQILSKSTVQTLAARMTPQISRNTIYGLAAGLGVTPLTVANAVLESWDIHTHPVEVTDSLATVRIDPTLSISDRQKIIALIEAMRADSVVDGHRTRRTISDKMGGRRGKPENGAGAAPGG